MTDLVKIVHPGTLGTAEVNRDALPHYYASGWRLLAPGEEAAQNEPEPEPEPVTMAAAKADKAGKTAKREEN